MFRDEKGRFVKGHPFGKRFEPGHKTWNKGKMGYTNSGSFIKGQTNPWALLRNLTNNPTKRGKEHHNWKGGIETKMDKIRSSLRCSKEWKMWRLAVFRRDNFTCQICKMVKGNLHPHHIERVVDCINNEKLEEIFNIDNGLTVCISCHKKIHGDYY